MDSRSARGPITVDVSITEVCNARCVFCHCWQSEGGGEFTIETWKRFCSELSKEFVVKYVCFGGGEPYRRDGFLEFVRAVHENEMASIIVTNGIAMTERRAAETRDSGNFILNFSLDGFEETHDEMRGFKGCFEQVLRGIDNVRKVSPDHHIALSTMINERNAPEIAAFTRWALDKLAIDCINFQAYQQVTRYEGIKWYENDPLWPKMNETLDRALSELAEIADADKRIFNPPRQFADFRRYFAEPLSDLELVCKAGHTGFALNSKGDVFMCAVEAPVGNIQRAGVSEIFYGEGAGAHRVKSVDCSENCHFLINCYYDKESGRHASYEDRFRELMQSRTVKLSG
ncbi:MAG: radical SAM protein [Planctomycetes bacterium]|nr:radical SAM protein [Planctomycetota bacterium]